MPFYFRMRGSGGLGNTFHPLERLIILDQDYLEKIVKEFPEKSADQDQTIHGNFLSRFLKLFLERTPSTHLTKAALRTIALNWLNPLNTLLS